MAAPSDLVLLPGMMCDGRLFAPQVARLSPRLRVSVPPIHGADTMAGLAAAVLDDAPERFALGGLSMGGIVAMEILDQAPERVSHLALMDTSPYAEGEEARAARGPQMERVRDGGLAGVMEEEMIPTYLAPAENQEPLLELCARMAEDLGADAFVRQSLALRDRPGYEEVLRRVSCPALILCGREDRRCPPERHQAMAGMIPHAELAIIEGAGHLPTLERPGEVNARLLRLLELEG